MAARGWNLPTAERGDELVHDGAPQKEDRARKRCGRAGIGQEL
jgi:hypothetical protein